MGQRDRAIAHGREQLGAGLPAILRLVYELIVAGLEGRREDAFVIADECLAKWRLRDPCGTFYLGRGLAAIQHPRALSVLRQAIEGGYYLYAFINRDPWLDSVRGSSEFRSLVHVAEAGYRDAATAYADAGGEMLLGPPD